MDVKDSYKFCPRCGAKFEKKPEFLKCNSCGLNYFINPKACNGLILRNKSGEIMLVERAIEPGKGLLDVPGGFVESGESFEDSMIREAKEELGIELKELKYMGSWVDSYNYQDITYPTLCVMFESKVDDDMVFKPADDVAGYKFFRPDSLPAEQFAFPWMSKFFKDFV